MSKRENGVLWTILVGLLLMAGSAQAFQNEPSGFRGIPWGTPLRSVPGMTSVPDGSKNFYFRADDNLSIGAAHLEHLSYKFYRDQFSEVLLRTHDSVLDEQAIIGAFKAQFGPGFQSNRYIDEYLWNGTTSTVWLNCNSITHACTAMIYSNQLKELEKADETAVARGAGKDF
jgi:hypothetical protein